MFDPVGKVVPRLLSACGASQGVEVVAGWAEPTLPPPPKEPGRVAQRRGVNNDFPNGITFSQHSKRVFSLPTPRKMMRFGERCWFICQKRGRIKKPAQPTAGTMRNEHWSTSVRQKAHIASRRKVQISFLRYFILHVPRMFILKLDRRATIFLSCIALQGAQRQGDDEGRTSLLRGRNPDLPSVLLHNRLANGQTQAPSWNG